MSTHTEHNSGVNSDKITPEITVALDSDLRPSDWDEYIGQTRVKKNLHILLSAAKARKQPPEHLLFYGPPGLGKTTSRTLLHMNLMHK